MSDEKLHLERNVTRLVKWGTVLLSIACLGGVGLLSAIWNLPIRLSPDLMQPGSLWKALISFYVVSWYFGTLFDSRYQITTASVERGRLPLVSILVAVAIFALFAAIWWADVLIESLHGRLPFALPWAATGDPFDVLILLLFVFWIFNIFAWRFYLARHIRPLVSATRAAIDARASPLRLDELDQVELFIAGRWQGVRFIVGALALLGIYAIAASNARFVLADGLALLIGAARVSSDQLARALPHLLILVWFLTSEAVIWLMRVRLKFYIDCIRELGRKYSVVPRPVT